MRHEVAVTGIGVVSPAGRGVDVLVDSIRRGECSLAIDPELERLGMRCRVSGRLARIDEQFADLPLGDVSPDFFSRHARIGAIAALDALEAADGAAIGRVVVASAAGPMSELELCFRDTLVRERHPKRTHAVTRVTSSFLATFLARASRAPRGGKTVSSACVSAIDAIREAFELVAHGVEGAVLVGAVDEDSPSTWWAFDAQRILGHARTPEERTRSLSGKPGGFLPSGGAAFFVFEQAAAARARGRAYSAKIAAACMQSDAETPSPLAFPLAAYRAALGVVSEGPPVDLVLAHAPPTVADPDELVVLDERLALLGARTPVRSFKSLFGYALGAAAAIDVALGIHQIGEGAILPNDRVDQNRGRLAAFAEILIEGVPTRTPRRVLKTAYAQSGAVGAVVIDAA